jgi:hypothetical protein
MYYPIFARGMSVALTPSWPKKSRTSKPKSRIVAAARKATGRDQSY